MTLSRSTRFHIAFVITNLGGSGADRTLLQTADGLVGLGHRVDIVLLTPGIRKPQEIPAAARLVLSESASDGELSTLFPCQWELSI